MAKTHKENPSDEPRDARSFEEVFAELEGVVAELEGGELPLERSLERFEVGLADYRRCIEILDGVEKRIEVLDRDARAPRPFAEAEGSRGAVEDPKA